MNIKRLRKILDYLCEGGNHDGNKYFQKSLDGHYVIDGFQCVVDGNNKVDHKQDSYITIIDLDNKTAKIKGCSYDGRKGDCHETTEINIEFTDLSDYYFETNFRSTFESALKKEEERKAQAKFNKMANKKIEKFLKE